MPEPHKPSVLFVCMGNICRSPAGEGYFRHLVAQRGLSEAFEIDSAGTIGYHAGSPADQRMREAAEARGYPLETRSRQVTNDDLEHFDLVIPMDRANLDDLLRMPTAVPDKIRLLGSFLPPDQHNHGGPPDVPDPYYGGDAGFQRVLDMIESACPAILEHLLAANQRG